MSLLNLASTVSVRSSQDRGPLQILLHHPVSILGILAMFGGIIVGNMGMWKMMDAYQESKSAVHEMFQTGEVTDPISPQAKRTEAIRQYQENQPDGPFHKMMQYGQVLTVAGALVMIFGALI